MRGNEVHVLGAEKPTVHRQRDALSDVCGVGVGIFNRKVFKPYAVARNAKRVRSESVVLFAVGVDFLRVVVEGYDRIFAAFADNCHVVRVLSLFFVYTRRFSDRPWRVL